MSATKTNMSATPKSTKWDDAAVKDLCMAIIMSNSPEGTISVTANWDKVTESMTNWGYSFTKSAMSQQWSKKIMKEFKERHGANIGSAGTKEPKKVAASRKKASGGKKRGADDDESGDGSSIAEPIAKKKTSRATKKVKYEDDAEPATTPEDEASAVDEEADYAI